jgi:uncharacterized protein YjbI with pentapeptide repeats
VGLDVPAPQNGSPAPDTIEVTPAVETAASVENRGLPPIPSPEPAAAQPTVAEAALPDFAKKADDLESIRKAVDDAATVGGALWFSYLFVLFYLAVAAGAVTHADLFLENPVKLPFLNIDLPLLAFFFVAPILFLFAHGYTLIHLVMLTEKAKDYDQALREQIGADSPASDKLRRQLPSNIFIQYLAGPANLRKSAFGYALGFVAWTTLAVAPVLLLLMMQLQFLPFHNLFITWTQRVAVVLDLALIWWLWGTIRSGREGVASSFWGAFAKLALSSALSLGVVLFAALSATFPGEWQESHFSRIDQLRVPTSIHDLVFNSEVDDSTRRRRLPFSNTLVLTGFNVLEGLHIDDPKKVDWRDFTFRARGRDLKGANFDFASLPRVDFTGARLEDASFYTAQLDLASFEKAQVEGVSLASAQLRGASLDFAQLQGAALIGAQLQGASLKGAQLQGAMLAGAQLQGASLDGAQLQGASLDEARLRGASLDFTQLQGASLSNSQLQGASLENAILDGADLSHAFLWRAKGSLQGGKDLELAGAVWGPFWIDFTAQNRRDQQPWEVTDYQNIRKLIEAVPAGRMRDQALARFGRLDCANPDKALAPCDPAAATRPPGVIGFRAAASDGDYQKVLAGTLKSIVCGADDHSIFVLRGLSLMGHVFNRLVATGSEMPALIDFIMSPACRVSAKLTERDESMLLWIKSFAP